MIDLISMPVAWIARMADSRPPPGPRTRTSTLLTPRSLARLPAFWPAICAANGVPFRDPLKPTRPADDQVSVLPVGSLIVTIVLLKVARICATP